MKIAKMDIWLWQFYRVPRHPRCLSESPPTEGHDIQYHSVDQPCAASLVDFASSAFWKGETDLSWWRMNMGTLT
jgi:hypothetical protein